MFNTVSIASCLIHTSLFQGFLFSSFALYDFSAAVLYFKNFYLCIYLFLSFFFSSLSRATPGTYGSSQSRGWIGAVATATPQPRYTTATATWDQAASATYTTAHSNTRSLTHWEGPGIEPTSSWILVGFISTEPQQELLLFKKKKNDLMI